jgi:hypothetical protein
MHPLQLHTFELCLLSLGDDACTRRNNRRDDVDLGRVRKLRVLRLRLLLNPFEFTFMVLQRNPLNLLLVCFLRARGIRLHNHSTRRINFRFEQMLILNILLQFAQSILFLLNELILSLCELRQLILNTGLITAHALADLRRKGTVS